MDLDEGEAARAARWFDRMRLPEVIGQPLIGEVVGDWYRDAVRALFGSYNKANNVRRIATVHMILPKKQGKTTLSGGTMLTALLMNKRPNARFGILGATQKISGEAYDSAAGMIEAEPKFKKFLKTTDHLKLIEHRLTGAYLEVTSFDTKVATGGKFAGCLVDELHVLGSVAAADRVIGQIRGARIAFPESFVWLITTQSEAPPAGIFAKELKYAREVRDGVITDPSYLPIIYEFPKHIQEDRNRPWENPELWRRVMPSLGSAVSRDVLEEQFRAEKHKGEADVRRWASQHLNIEIGIALGADSWVGAEFWPDAAEKALTLEKILSRCEVVVVGIDGGGADDLLSIYVIGRQRCDSQDVRRRKWFGWGHSWAFSDPVQGRGVVERRLSLEPQLSDFVEDGDLTIFTQPGAGVEGAVAIIKKIYDAGLLGGVGADPAGKVVASISDALELSEMTDSDGPLQVQSVSQGFLLQGAIGTCELELLSGRFIPADQRIMAWALGNAKAELKGSAQMIYKQAAGYAKIDPIMAMFDAIRLMSLNPEAPSGGFDEFAVV
ncbi:terminase large subunit domain-containing protein [Methylosinus sporium]|nr:terminase large subunit [Methylosinus sporium]